MRGLGLMSQSVRPRPTAAHSLLLPGVGKHHFLAGGASEAIICSCINGRAPISTLCFGWQAGPSPRRVGSSYILRVEGSGGGGSRRSLRPFF